MSDAIVGYHNKDKQAPLKEIDQTIGLTKISSRKPEAQETIEKIRKKEFEQNASETETHNHLTHARESR